MNSSGLKCCLCAYKAPSEFDLEIHIDYNHADIFRFSNPNQTFKQEEEDDIRETSETVSQDPAVQLLQDPVGKEMEKIFAETPNKKSSSGSSNTSTRGANRLNRPVQVKNVKGRRNVTLPDTSYKPLLVNLPKTNPKQTATPSTRNTPSYNQAKVNAAHVNRQNGISPSKRSVKRRSTSSVDLAQQVEMKKMKEEKPVIQASSFIEALDSLREELNECKLDNVKLKKDLINYDYLQSELQLLKTDNSKELKLTAQIEKQKKQISDSSRQNSDLSKQLKESNSLNQKLESDNSALEKQIKDLEQKLEAQKKVHDKDLKELTTSKESCYDLNNRLNGKLSELSQSRLSEERYGLEVSKLKNELKWYSQSVELLKPDAARFCSIIHTFKQVIAKDEQFCSSDNETESFQSLSADELCELVNYTLLESIESKQTHFADIENCLSKMSIHHEQRQNQLLVIKELTFKIRAQNEILKEQNVDLDSLRKNNSRLSSELNVKSTALQNHIKKMEDFVKIIENFKERESVAQKTISKYENDIEQLYTKDLKSSNLISLQSKQLAEKETSLAKLKTLLDHLNRQGKEDKTAISKLKEEQISSQQLVESLESNIHKLQRREMQQEEALSSLKNDFLVKNLMFTALQKSKYKVDRDLERSHTENRSKDDYLEQLRNQLKCQESEYGSALQIHKEKFCDLEKQFRAMTCQKETLLSELNNKLQTREELLRSMKKIVAWKTLQVTKLEADINQLVQKSETLDNTNEKYKKDLVWARNYCLEMNAKVKELEQRASTNQIIVPNGNFFPGMNPRQAQVNYGQTVMLNSLNFNEPNASNFAIPLHRSNSIDLPRQGNSGFNPSVFENGYPVQGLNNNTGFQGPQNSPHPFVMQNIQSLSEADFNRLGFRTHRASHSLESRTEKVTSSGNNVN